MVRDEEMVKQILVSEEEYLQLKKDSEKLQALIAVGVDNWDGYDDAMEILDR